MHPKKVSPALLISLLIALLVCPVTADLKKVQMFKKVNFPYNLIHDETTIEKGKYDILILAYREVRQWSLKIMKKGETLCILNGIILRDECPGARGEEMKDVPEEATLKLSRVPVKKILNIIFEAGWLTEYYTCYKVKFPIQYEE